MTICANGCQHGLRCHFLMHAFQWLSTGPVDNHLIHQIQTTGDYTPPTNSSSTNPSLESYTLPS